MSWTKVCSLFHDFTRVALLPLCFGEATKFSADLLDADKTYEAELKLGVTTDTSDAEGRVLATSAVNLAESDILAALPAFTGNIAAANRAQSAIKTYPQAPAIEEAMYIMVKAYEALEMTSRLAIMTTSMRPRTTSMTSVSLMCAASRALCTRWLSSTMNSQQ